jgi:hypothetical protein
MADIQQCQQTLANAVTPMSLQIEAAVTAMDKEIRSLGGKGLKVPGIEPADQGRGLASQGAENSGLPTHLPSLYETVGSQTKPQMPDLKQADMSSIEKVRADAKKEKAEGMRDMQKLDREYDKCLAEKSQDLHRWVQSLNQQWNSGACHHHRSVCTQHGENFNAIQDVLAKYNPMVASGRGGGIGSQANSALGGRGMACTARTELNMEGLEDQSDELGSFSSIAQVVAAYNREAAQLKAMEAAHKNECSSSPTAGQAQTQEYCSNKSAEIEEKNRYVADLKTLRDNNQGQIGEHQTRSVTPETCAGFVTSLGTATVMIRDNESKRGRSRATEL